MSVRQGPDRERIRCRGYRIAVRSYMSSAGVRPFGHRFDVNLFAALPPEMKPSLKAPTSARKRQLFQPFVVLSGGIGRCWRWAVKTKRETAARSCGPTFHDKTCVNVIVNDRIDVTSDWVASILSGTMVTINRVRSCCRRRLRQVRAIWLRPAGNLCENDDRVGAAFRPADLERMPAATTHRLMQTNPPSR